MTATEIELHRNGAQPDTIPAKIAYARALAESGLLPGAYRKQPANILWAVEYGDMLGLSTMAAITGVHVIDGKPTASAGLISALIRRAGHRLRVRGDGKSATCQIIRADDPGHVFEVTWTLRKTAGDNPSAEEAKLLGKDVWQKYPAAMLKSRAITQCARDACEEALFGLHYTPEELGADVDEDGVVIDPAPAGGGKPAARSAGTPPDDPWYVRPPCDDPEETGPPAADGSRRWADTAIAQAASFKTEAEGTALWKEAAARHLGGECTRDEQDHIQRLVEARIHDRRREAATRILRPLAEGDPWRDKILDELASDDDAREVLADVRQQLGSGQVDDELASLLGRAVIARFPKAAIAAEADAP
jgi:hypothetical protein